MSKIWILIRAQLINFFPINEMKEPGNKKQSSIFIASFGIITLAIFFCVYNIMTAKTLVQVGQQELIPAYMIAVSSFSILFLTIFYSNGILFGSRDIETLSSLPLKSSDIISSKFMFMYLLNFLIGFIFMLPGGDCLGVKRKLKCIADYIVFYLHYFCSIDTYEYSSMYGNHCCGCFILF